MKKMIMILTISCMVFSLSLAGNAEEILFEDNFEGTTLGSHWSVTIDREASLPSLIAGSFPDYYVEDGKLFIDTQPGDNYFDLEGYTFTGDYTIEVKFMFSSERSENPGNFLVWFHRPEDFDGGLGWYDTAGHIVGVRRWDEILCFWELREGIEMPLWEVLWGRTIYDEWFVLKVIVNDNMVSIYLDDEDITASVGFESGIEIIEFPYGGFSFSVYDSLMWLDYIKVYR